MTMIIDCDRGMNVQMESIRDVVNDLLDYVFLCWCVNRVQCMLEIWSCGLGVSDGQFSWEHYWQWYWYIHVNDSMCLQRINNEFVHHHAYAPCPNLDSFTLCTTTCTHKQKRSLTTLDIRKTTLDDNVNDVSQLYIEKKSKRTGNKDLFVEFERTLLYVSWIWSCMEYH